MIEPILLAQRAAGSAKPVVECVLLSAMANRHGLITGATGTGETVTLQTLAENFSRRGVPVFLSDVKGDLTGITRSGGFGDKLAATLAGGSSADGDAGGGLLDGLKNVMFGGTGPRGGHHESIAESAARSAMRRIGSSVGREIVRGVLGSLLGGRR